MKLLSKVIALLLIIGLLPWECAAQFNSFSVAGGPPVGDVGPVSFSSPSSFFSVGTYGVLDRGADVHATDGKDGWIISLTAAKGTKLSLGCQLGLPKFGLGGPQNGSLVYGNNGTIGSGGGCSNAVSHVNILDYTVDSSGKTTSFAADAVQYCDGASKPLIASVRYNSFVPPSQLGTAADFFNSFGCCRQLTLKSAGNKRNTLLFRSLGIDDLRGRRVGAPLGTEGLNAIRSNGVVFTGSFQEPGIVIRGRGPLGRGLIMSGPPLAWVFAVRTGPPKGLYVVDQKSRILKVGVPHKGNYLILSRVGSATSSSCAG